MTARHLRALDGAHRAWRRSTAFGRALSDAVRSGLVASVVLGAIVVGTATPAVAYWSAGVAPGAIVGATVTQLGTVAAPALSTSTSNVTLTWAAAKLGDGTAADRYDIVRTSPNGVSGAASGTCASAVVGTTCQDTGLTEGVWQYAVTPRFSDNWRATPSTTAQIRVDLTAPSTAITATSDSGVPTYLTALGANYRLFYRAASGGSVRLTTTVTDTGSGPKSVSTGAVSATGWTHAPSSVTTNASGVAVSQPFTVTAGASSTFNVGVSAFDKSDNVAARNVEFVADTTAPTDPSVDLTAGAQRAPQVTTAITSTDAGSGIDRIGVTRRTAPLVDGSCGTFSVLDTSNVPPGIALTDRLPEQKCVVYELVAYDRVGNASQTTVTPAVWYVSTYPSLVARDGATNHWRLNDAASPRVADAIGTAHGTSMAAVGFGSPSALSYAGADTSFTFHGSSAPGGNSNDNERVFLPATPQGTAFSLEFWFTAANGTGQGDARATWHDGRGLVDAYYSGSTVGLGVVMFASGAVGAGLGSSADEITIRSADRFDDGAWHHVVFTRNGSTISLFVDGVQRATSATATAAPVSATVARMRVGALQTGYWPLTGSVDEVAIYPTALTAAQITEHNRLGRAQ